MIDKEENITNWITRLFVISGKPTSLWQMLIFGMMIARTINLSNYGISLLPK
jgi:hypothetical protein